MEVRSTLLLAVLTILCKYAAGQSPAEDAARQKCLKSQVAGSAIEKIMKSDTSKQFYEITDESKMYRYQIGLCATVGEGMAAVMQYNISDSKQKYVLGRLNNTHVIQRHDYIELEYFGGQKYRSHCSGAERTARIIFVCDPCGGVGKPVVVEEVTTSAKTTTNAHCFYLFEWPTRHACSPDHGLLVVCTGKGGVGAIVVLVLLGLFVAYILIGIAYKRIFLGAKGCDQFPHIDHWKMFGNLIADGCDCLCRRKRPLKPSYTSVYNNDHLEDIDNSETEDEEDLLPLS